MIPSISLSVQSVTKNLKEVTEYVSTQPNATNGNDVSVTFIICITVAFCVLCAVVAICCCYNQSCKTKLQEQNSRQEFEKMKLDHAMEMAVKKWENEKSTL